MQSAERSGMDEKREQESYERAHDPARVLALSDGVFAIILTLLVLEIHVPELAQCQSLADASREIRPRPVFAHPPDRQGPCLA